MIVTSILKSISDPSAVHEDSYYCSILPIVDRSDTISRNLFQICLQDSNQSSESAFQSLPIQFKDNVERLRCLHKNWDYHLISNMEAADFIRDNYGESVYSYYNRINPKYGAARADFLRYLLLYYYGGAYLDIKSGVTHSLEESMKSPLFPIFYWDNMPGGNHHPAIPERIKEGEIYQGFIVSPAGHPFLRKVIVEVMKRIDIYNPYSDGIGYGGVMKVTGPGMYTETIYDCSLEHPDDCYIAKMIGDFGFVFNNLGDPSIVNGGYQKKLKMTDYRKQTEPLVSSGNRLLDFINKHYLKLLANRH